MEARLTASDYRILALLLVVVGIAYSLTMRSGHDWGSDFSIYIAHARNIATGHPYAENSYIPDAESTSSVHMPATYPPVFPLLLAPVYRVYNLNFAAFKVVVEAMFLLALAMYYILARLRGLDAIPALFAGLAFGLSELVLHLKESVLSDGAYLFFAAAALAGIVYTYQRRWDQTRPILSAIGIGLLMLLAYATRASGIALLLAFGLYELWTARKIRLFGVIATAVFCAGVLLLAVTLYDSRTYSNQFPFLPRAYLDNIIYYLHSPASLWGGAPRLFRYPVAAISILVVAIQFLRCMRSPSVVEFYFAISVFMVIVYSLGQTDRYVLPLYPLFLMYLAEAVQWFTETNSTRWRTWAVPAFGAIISIGAVFNLAALDRGPITEGVEKATFHDVCQFLTSKTSPDSTLVSWNPRVFALYTGRHTTWYVQTTDDARFDTYLTSMHASHVIVYRQESEDNAWLAPHIQHEPNHFQEVYENPDFRVYQVTPNGQPSLPQK